MVHKVKNFTIGIVLLVLVWQLVAMFGNYEEALFPRPATVFIALLQLFLDGTLFIHMTEGMFRFIFGYVSAAISGILLGLLLGRSKYMWHIIDPVVQILRPISPVAWSPFIVLAFGIGDMPAIVIIFIAAFFPILLTTVKGVRSVEDHFLKLAANLQFSTLQTYQKVIFPAALPSIISGLHLALATAWVFLVAGEMVGSQSGLGYLIVDSRNTLNMANVLAGIVIIGLLGFMLDRLLTFIEMSCKKLLRFQL